MLKTNAKKVKEALRKHILDTYEGRDGFAPETPEAQATTPEEIARVIMLDVKRVHGIDVERGRGRYTWQDAFVEQGYQTGLLFDTSFVCHGSAVDFLGDILEETAEERNRYTEAEAELMTLRLLYRECYAMAGNDFRF